MSAPKATLVGDVFDDAATGQALLNYFLRAMNCRAITEAEAVGMSGLTVAELGLRDSQKKAITVAAPSLPVTVQ